MKFSNSKTVIDWIIKDSEWNILVVDKVKKDWTYTILPWWKIEHLESDDEALKREVFEELWIQVEVWNKIWEIFWFTDFWNKPINVILYEAKTSEKNFHAEAEITNPRYLSIAEILELKTTTELTRKAIELLISN